MNEKRRRQAALLELLRERELSNQNEMVALLKKCGFPSTQASISRDVRELGLIKVDGHYIPTGALVGPQARPGSDGPANELITNVASAGANLVVVRTAVGAASAVAVDLDRRLTKDVVGTLAGDDTIFVAVRSRSAQGRVVSLLRRMVRPELGAATS
ncbi:MAG: arginine repressor [Phycisphaerales bacterium]|nr:arginine repressor [Phycisphaerales bacterium]